MDNAKLKTRRAIGASVSGLANAVGVEHSLPVPNFIAPLVPLGRLMLVAIFLVSGLDQAANFTATAAMLSHKGIPVPASLLAFAVTFELAGGISVLTGYKARIGAVLLMLFLVPVTPIFHDYWNLSGMERALQQTHFAKNVAIFGALLVVAIEGAGAFSLDNVISRNRAIALSMENRA